MVLPVRETKGRPASHTYIGIRPFGGLKTKVSTVIILPSYVLTAELSSMLLATSTFGGK